MKTKANGAPRCALAVDDDPNVRLMVSALLIQLGYHVTTAGNAQEASAILDAEGNAFDLIVTDYQMPGATGADLIRQVLASISPPPNLVLFTAMPLDLPAIEDLRAEVEGRYPVAFANKNMALKTLLAKFREIAK